MGAVLLPQKFLAQPQYSPQVSEAYRDAQLLSLFGSGSTKNLVGDNDLIAGAGGLPTRILNQQGYALKFNPGDLITEQVITIPSGLPGLTVFAWVRPNVLNESYRRIAETSYVDGFYLGTDNAGGNYLFTTNGASLSNCVGGQQVVGQRDFVCGTWDGTNRILYVNGEQVASSTSTKPSANRKMTVGSNASGGESWLGDIDTVGVFFRAFPASEVWSLYQDPWQLVRPQPRRIFVSAAVGGTTYNQAVAGSLTPAGALSRLTGKNTAGSITSAGNIVKQTAKSYGGSATPSGTLAKQTAKSYSGSITPSSLLTSAILFTASVAGSITASGALNKLTMKALSGVSTISGAITKMTGKGLSASLTVSGGLNKLTAKAFAGAITVAGALSESYQVLKSLAGSITVTGAVAGLYVAFVAGILKMLALMGVG